MKLISFGVKNFRSIHEATNIKFENNVIVLLGPNNEGKSNLLIALKIAFDVINGNGVGLRPRISPRYSSRMSSNDSFVFNDDFPVTNPQERNKTISFSLLFLLTDDEKKEIALPNNNLEINIRISEVKLKIDMNTDEGSIKDDDDNNRYKNILKFISKCIYFQYIPAVRTQQHSLEIIQSLVDNELQVIEQNEKYSALISALKTEQKEKMQSIGEKLTSNLKVFLPYLRNVDVKLEDENSISRRAFRSSSSRDFIFNIDDGVANTSLSKKGDGVISLVTMGLMQQFFTENREGSCILAIEEPESHLHPAAIHSLNKLLMEMAKTNQLIITTHNPIMIAFPVRANIIVAKHIPHIAADIEEIRTTLGIHVSDNLASAEVVLLVEGKEDKIAMEFLLPRLSIDIGDAMKQRRLVIETLEGGSNLVYKINELKRSVCRYLCVLDNDKCGRDALEKVKDITLPKEILLTPCGKNEESEMEDCFDISVYENLLKAKFSPAILSSKSFKDTKYNWSKRIQIYCSRAHMNFDDNDEAKLKFEVAQALTSAKNPLNRKGKSFFKALIEQLLFQLKVLSK